MVAVKWVLLEPDSQAARDLVGVEPFLAPDFLMLEGANVLSQQVRRRKLTAVEAAAGLARIRGAGVRLTRTDPHVDAAQRLATALGASAYDSLHLAVALAQPCRLLTADARFADLVEPAHPGVVRRL